MKILIFGSKGNMGRRYTAILKYLEHDVFGIDYDEPSPELFFRNYDAFIVATPTPTHLQFLRSLLFCEKPVLCEKPIVTPSAGDSSSLTELKHFLHTADQENMQLSMVSQYDYMLQRADDGSLGDNGLTSYDFYQSGKDGLAWDCINVIWQAKGRIELKNESPIWRCSLNGVLLDIGEMNNAYVDMIEDWLDKPYYQPQYERILASHQKVLDYLDGKFN